MNTVLDIPKLEEHHANLTKQAQGLAATLQQAQQRLISVQGALSYVESQLRELKAAKPEDSPPTLPMVSPLKLATEQKKKERKKRQQVS